MAWLVEILSASEILWEDVLIFLTVGNWHKGFDRLVKAVDKLIEHSVITEDVIAQIGSGKYKPANLEYVEYCSPEKFEKHLRQARVIITHAGMGTIGLAVELVKPVIVVPRKKSLDEHVDDHQYDTAEMLEKEKKVLVAYDVTQLPDRLQLAKTFLPAAGENGQKIIDAVEQFINGLRTQKCL